MNGSKHASFELPRHFRFYGFLFFMAGSFFHTIDFLGVENTVIWGMELTFFGALALSLLLWTRYAVHRRLWKFLV